MRLHSAPAILLVVLVPLLLADPAAAAGRWWVELPRAQVASEPADLPFPPRPTEAALERRALRGRPDRVDVLTRGPSEESLRAVRATGARIVRVSRWLSAASVEADPASLARLRQAFGDAALRPVRTWSGEREPRVAEVGIAAERRVGAFDYGRSFDQLAQIRVDRLHERGLTGHGVRVLVLDTGYQVDHSAVDHLDVVATRDFVNGDADVGIDDGEALDQDRHGTGVVGTMAGLEPGRLVGAAPHVSVLLAKTEVVGSETRVEEDNFVAALEWGEALGADVMTASLGYRTFYDEPDTFAYAPEDLDGDTAVTTRAVDDLVAMGVVAISSAGNDGDEPQTLLTPADADSGLAVAAVDSNGIATWFSSRGPTADGRIKPDLAARGLRVVWADTWLGVGLASGTSLAAPLVAGASALLLQAHPAWGPGEVAAALRATASRSSDPDNTLGWGIVDAEAAVFDVEAPQVPLPFGLVAPDSGAVAEGARIDFAWEAAEDLQTPEAIDYRIEIAPSEDFTDTAAVFEVGTALTRTAWLPLTGELWWRVVATDPDGHRRTSAARAIEVPTATGAPAPTRVSWARWEGPWPNPTSDRSAVRLVLGRPARLHAVEVFDLAGRRVRTLRRQVELLPGEWRVEWDGRDSRGRSAASGVYLLRARLEDSEGRTARLHTRLLRLR
jgi:subtilisin family serine protease